MEITFTQKTQKIEIKSLTDLQIHLGAQENSPLNSLNRLCAMIAYQGDEKEALQLLEQEVELTTDDLWQTAHECREVLLKFCESKGIELEHL